jgi:hypothetical protein
MLAPFLSQLGMNLGDSQVHGGQDDPRFEGQFSRTRQSGISRG